MPFLRAARQMHRLLVLAYALALGVATAAPLVQPQAMEQICAARGEMRWTAAPDADTDTGAAAGHALDCALCSPIGPPQARLDPVGWTPPREDLPWLAGRAPLARPARAPMPPRGPPALC